MKKEYTGVEVDVVVFKTAEIIVASAVTESTSPNDGIVRDSDDLPILPVI